MRVALHSLQSKKRDAKTIAIALYYLADDRMLPEGSFERLAWGYWDEIDLSRGGYRPRSEASILQEMEAAMVAYLDDVSEFLQKLA